VSEESEEGEGGVVVAEAAKGWRRSGNSSCAAGKIVSAKGPHIVHGRWGFEGGMGICIYV